MEIKLNLFFVVYMCLSPHIRSVQSFSHAQLFVTLWIAARQASPSFTISQSLLKLMSIESGMPSNHLTLCHPHLPNAIISQHQGLF